MDEFKSFFSSFRTEKDIVRIIGQLEDCLEQSGSKNQKITVSSLPIIMHDYFPVLFDRKTDVTPQLISELVVRLKKELDEAAILALKVSFEPNNSFVDQVSEWLAKNVEKKILLKFEVDEKLMGGAVIFYNGQFHDYSLQKKYQIEIGDNTLLHLLKGAV